MATHTGHDHGGHAGHEHDAHGHHVSHLPADRGPAYVGLLGGGAVTGAILYAVVALTNRHFEANPVDRKGHGTPPAAAQAHVTSTPGTPAPAAAPAGGGTMHKVQMLGDASGYRFEPANFTVKAGDRVQFINVSGGPHNAAFNPEEVPDDVEAVLTKNMPNQMAPLQGALLVNPNETYEISFAGVKPGAYNYFCSPHIAMNMKGVITVQ